MKLTFLDKIKPVIQFNQSIPNEDFFNDLRQTEFERLDLNRQIYLDYTGGGLYGKSQVLKHQELLLNYVFGNPHSNNPTSQLSTDLAEENRQKVKEFFNAKDYYCVFTSNASGALKLIGECYPFSQDSIYLMLADNHNSVNGIREYCKKKGGVYRYSRIQYEDLCLNEPELLKNLNSFKEFRRKLFAFPAQSNVTGVKHNLKWVEIARKKGWDVLLDIAAYCPTSKVDLAELQPDFATLSFYKIFGYPTGLGCLFIKKSKFNILKKPWFAGGTVQMASARTDNHILFNDHEKFENGTINYLDLPAISIGLDFIKKIRMERITPRVLGLTQYLVNELKQIKHENGNPVVKILGPEDRSLCGATVMMNLFDNKQEMIPASRVESMASLHFISIRTGCFCNPGIDEVNSCISADELTRYFSSKSNGNYYDMIRYLGKLRGAVRISLGIATTKADLDVFIGFVKKFADIRQLMMN